MWREDIEVCAGDLSARVGQTNMYRRPLSVRSLITPEQVLSAYQQGVFPMAQGRYGTIRWYIAEPRAIIPLDERFKVRRSLQKVRRKSSFQLTLNRDFEAVIRACARHDQVSSREVWLSEEMIELYLELHHRGAAHSIEVWEGSSLAGGLYGVAIKAAFFGESMFSRLPYASQLALIALVERLRERDYQLLDAQIMTPHIAQFGAINLTHQEYLNLLVQALSKERTFV
jgi:leucyl/phenylalanyl-tRNA--protein transferase